MAKSFFFTDASASNFFSDEELHRQRNGGVCKWIGAQPPTYKPLKFLQKYIRNLFDEYASDSLIFTQKTRVSAVQVNHKQIAIVCSKNSQYYHAQSSLKWSISAKIKTPINAKTDLAIRSNFLPILNSIFHHSLSFCFANSYPHLSIIICLSFHFRSLSYISQLFFAVFQIFLPSSSKGNNQRLILNFYQ